MSLPKVALGTLLIFTARELPHQVYAYTDATSDDAGVAEPTQLPSGRLGVQATNLVSDYGGVSAPQSLVVLEARGHLLSLDSVPVEAAALSQRLNAGWQVNSVTEGDSQQNRLKLATHSFTDNSSDAAGTMEWSTRISQQSVASSLWRSGEPEKSLPEIVKHQSQSSDPKPDGLQESVVEAAQPLVSQVLPSQSLPSQPLPSQPLPVELLPNERLPNEPLPGELEEDDSDAEALGQRLPDIQNHWAESFIEPLVERGLLVGFPDNTFRPDAVLTRAEFAAMIRRTFSQTFTAGPKTFTDVPTGSWASGAINAAVQTGFLVGYPDGQFRPDQPITRSDVLVALSNGLDLESPGISPEIVDSRFQDANQIPAYARGPIAALLANEVIVNYPRVNQLQPTQAATRAETAATIYQALVAQGSIPALSGQNPATAYIVPAPVAPVASQPQPTTTSSAETLREQYQLPELPDVAVLDADPNDVSSAPGITIGSPSAFGASWGDIFVGGTFQERARFTNQSDGAIALGFGLGDAEDAVGLEVALSIV